MARLLEAIIEGEDTGLKDALEDVRDAAGEAAGALERVEESVSNIRDDAAATANSLDSVADNLEETTGASATAAKGLEEAGDEATGLTIRTESLSIAADEASDELNELGASAGAESGAASAAAAANRALAGSLDEVEDEADEATSSMARTASMAELLSLESSALSINVGAFTIALRNLTTQVPLLVASLGNLSTAMVGLHGAVGAIGLGGFAAALGGAVAEMERLAGEAASMQRKMQAMQAIGEEFLSMLREGIQPLVEMEGAAEVFKNLLEEIATTVRVFSEAIAESFENGPLATALDNISDAWMDSIDDIAAAIQEMVRVIGVPISEVIADAIRAFDNFIVFVTNITNDMMSIMGTAGESIGSFIRGLMRLGIAIGAGLAPVLHAFFDIVGDIADALLVTRTEIQNFQNTAEGAGTTIQQAAEQLSGFRIETIATAAKIIALLFAINRLAGIMGGVLQPLALMAGHIGEIAVTSKSMSEAFFRVSGRVVQGTSNMSRGFGRLATSMSALIPIADDNESNLSALADRMRENGGVTGMLRTRLSGLSDTLDLSALRMRLFGESAEEASEDMGFLEAKMSALQTRLSGFVQGFEAPDLGNAFRAMGEDIESGEIVSPMAIRRGLPDFEKFQVGQQLELIDERGAEESLSGLSAIRQRLVLFRDNTLARIQNLNTRFFNRLIGIRDSIRRAGGGITGALSVLRAGIAQRISAIRETISGFSIRSLMPSMDGSFVDQLMRPFNRLSNLDIEGAVSRPFERLSDLDISGAVWRPFARLNELSIGSKLSGIVGRFRNIPGAIAGVIPSLEGVRDSINDVIGRFSLLSFSSIRSAFSFGVLGSAATALNAKFEVLRAKIMSTSLASLIARTNFTTLFTSMATSGIPVVSGLGRAFSVLTNVMRGNLALTTGLKAAYAALVGVSGSASAGTLAFATAETIASAATSLLSGGISVLLGVLGSLAIVLTAVVAALGAFVVIAGSVAAVLMKIGSSGASAKEIIGSLKDTLSGIVDSLMPLFVASGNMMIDIFNSLMAPIEEFINGLTDIGVALGFMEEGAAEGVGAMDMLRAGVGAIVPVVQRVGDLFRQVFGVFAGVIRVAMNSLQEFLVSINFGDKVRMWVATLKDLGRQALTLIGPIRDFLVGVASNLISVGQNLIDSIMEIVTAFKNALGIGGDAFGGYLDIVKGIWEAIMSLVAPALNLLGSIFGALAGITNTFIDIVTAGFKVLAGIIGFVVDLLDGILGVFGTDTGQFFNSMVEAAGMAVQIIGDLMNALAGVIDTLGALMNMLGTVVGFVFDVAMQIYGVIGDLIISVIVEAVSMIVGLIETIGRALSGVIDPLVSAFTGLVDVISNVVDTIAQLFFALPDMVAQAWNSTIGGFELSIPSVTLGGNIKEIPDMTIGGQTLTLPELPSPGGGGGGGGASLPSESISGSQMSAEDLTEGPGRLANVAGQAAQTAGMGGAPGRVEYSEGDTIQNFRQNISANPEDKAQISRIAKDAMKEANSFERRQQGGQ